MLPSGCKSVIGSAMWIGRSSADPTYHYWLIDTTKEATYATWDALTPQWWQDTFAIAHDLTVVHRQACPKTPPILPFDPSMFHMDMSENGVEIDPPSTNNIIKGNMLKIHFFLKVFWGVCTCTHEMTIINEFPTIRCYGGTFPCKPMSWFDLFFHDHQPISSCHLCAGIFHETCWQPNSRNPTLKYKIQFNRGHMSAVILLHQRGTILDQ